MAIQFFKFVEWMNKLVLVLIVNKGKSMNVIYKAEIKFPSAETSRDILLEKQFPFLLNKMENNYFSFHIFPTGIATSSLVTTTGCFSYKERINDRRQTTRAVASATELPDTSASSARQCAFGSCWGHRAKTDYKWHVPMYSCTVSLRLWYGLPVLSANHW